MRPCGKRRASLGDYAERMGLVPADLGDIFGTAFFVEKLDTATISERTGIPEPLVYNALNAWREQGRARTESFASGDGRMPR